MSIKLRDLIRSVRACKTAAEERAVIAKECALIRTAIKEEQEQYRHRNVAKLMYIHMLGYPTHFGQMECLKLISAPTFPEKRIGYLGLTLLLTESTEVLTLVTNSLKIDLSNSNQYIVALSLIAIGNLSTQDMARDLASDVEKLLKANNSYLRKKAALATIRLLRKEPDLVEHMSDRIISLLKDRAHGVLITGVQLITEVVEMLPEYAANYARLVPSLVRLLRNFISMGYSPEHDVSGITDPFLQVKILRLLKYLGKGNEEASDQMNDVLAQVATNTETAKNAGNAILYECVLTIMEVESDSGLRVLAVNILGRFLLNRDNNIRYVALNTLSKVVSEDIAAVQRHRNTIVDCLKDNDISIRQRALELIYQLVNETNVIALTTELLNYLVVAQSEHKSSLVSKLMQVIESFSPSKKWRVDTIITMLSIAGNQCDESIPRTSILFLAQAEGLQGYAVHRLYRQLSTDTSQIGLVHVGLWCIGEYGELLVRPCASVDDSQPMDAVAEDAAINLLDKCSRIHNADTSTKALVLNALVKLTVRVSDSSRQVIHEIIDSFKNSMSIELQQRSAEYSMLLSTQWNSLRSELLSKMPVLDEATMRKRRAAFEENGTSGDLMAISSGTEPSAPSASTPLSAPVVAAKPASSNGTSLLDLDDIFGGGAPPPAPSGGNPNAAPPPPAAGMDLLSDIFSTMGSGSAPMMPTQPGLMSQSNSNPMDLLSMGGAPAPPAAPAPAPSGMSGAPVQPQTMGASSGGPLIVKGFDKGPLQINFELSKPSPAVPANTRIIAKFANQSATPITNLMFQAAVPKYLKLELLPASSSTIPPNSNGAVSQEVRLINSMQGEKSIMLKLKISYAHDGKTVDEMAQVSSFPPMY
mmetsp:Transcript_18114/g.18172  ORF Transcript_18114/g.18172 Transcript_18114/m.18172 type:complete len:870 (+) Transcript_18114:126-2735(+)|eukprot:CAMPEP_0182428712 /NCGR_PEP_ID=MMETSP1167-20130531/23225_1 /TAXON_ID=2988 /ORGANISM="Mallomonas Sp, Strain CCMP3275" /LENGTH=869 /DNA_ID=CAMNT_0024611755 /DNA_START=120 /DNA_END=2729 /DNA_ORIENTATION=-